MKFNSQICTTREQSERLLALGLKKETADMVYTYEREEHGDNYYWNLEVLEGPWDSYIWPSNGTFIPAWSLHRLLCFLPKHIQVYDEVWKFKRNLYLSIDEDFNVRYEENIDEPCFDKIFWAYDIYQNCIDAIEWLIKEGYFNKEYLV
jgi:hypothetical protein